MSPKKCYTFFLEIRTMDPLQKSLYFLECRPHMDIALILALRLSLIYVTFLRPICLVVQIRGFFQSSNSIWVSDTYYVVLTNLSYTHTQSHSCLPSSYVLVNPMPIKCISSFLIFIALNPENTAFSHVPFFNEPKLLWCCAGLVINDFFPSTFNTKN